MTEGRPCSHLWPKRRPAFSVKCHSDRTTKIEAAVWPYETTSGDGTVLTRFGIVLSRSYRDQQGVWHNPEKDGQGRALNSMFSAHDVPVVLYLLEKCHMWCLDQRITVS